MAGVSKDKDSLIGHAPLGLAMMQSSPLASSRLIRFWHGMSDSTEGPGGCRQNRSTHKYMLCLFSCDCMVPRTRCKRPDSFATSGLA